jgi:hypothetical protein
MIQLADAESLDSRLLVLQTAYRAPYLRNLQLLAHFRYALLLR